MFKTALAIGLAGSLSATIAVAQPTEGADQASRRVSTYVYMVNATKDKVLVNTQFFRNESCGKCGPCREGTNWTQKMVERIYSGEATPMDLDIMASVQEQIIGNCLCVLGDAMAMPIGSMVQKFRSELEAEIEAARERADGAAVQDVVALGVADEHAGWAGSTSVH